MFDSSKEKTIADLTTRLKLSDDRLKEAIRALAPRHTGNEKEEYKAANEENLRLQRELAQLKEMPVAYPLEGIPQWDVGAPMPHVLSSGYRTILLYYVQDIDPNWDGSYVKIRSTSSEEVSRIAVVEFHHCYAYKFGGPNDEVLDGHPLWHCGLEPYSAHQIENSLWIKEEMQTNSVHSQFDPDHWQNRKHFLFLFHDELFECIAGGFTITVQSGPFGDIAQAAFTTVFTD